MCPAEHVAGAQVMSTWAPSARGRDDTLRIGMLETIRSRMLVERWVGSGHRCGVCALAD
jgi:hypothetical protein